MLISAILDKNIISTIVDSAMAKKILYLHHTFKFPMSIKTEFSMLDKS